MNDLDLKTTLDKYGVPREDLPTVAERALGGKSEIYGEVLSLLQGLYTSSG